MSDQLIKGPSLQQIDDIVNNKIDTKKQFFMGGSTIIQKRRQGQVWYDARSGWQKYVNGKIQKCQQPENNYSKIPWVCPICKKTPLSNFVHTTCWKATGKCYKCYSEQMTSQLLDGSYQTRQLIKQMKNYLSYAKDAKAQIMQYKFDVQVLKKNIQGNIQIQMWHNDTQLMQNFRSKWIKQIQQWEQKVKQVLIKLEQKLQEIIKKV